MLALAIIVSVLFLIAVLRFGVVLEYSKAGLLLWATAGFLKFSILGEDKEKKPKKKKKKEKEKKTIDFKPGSLNDFINILNSVKNALSRLKRRLLITKLILYYTSAGDNPANTAIQYGAANAVFSAIIPVLERNFRIRRRDLKAAADFNAKEQGIYAKISISIAVWEVFYILFALFPIITALFKSKPRTKNVKLDRNDRKDRKVGSENGKSPDQRHDGENDAESKGDD